MPLLYVSTFMAWNEEEAQKSHLFGDLKPTHIAIDLGGWIYQNQVPISRKQDVQQIGGDVRARGRRRRARGKTMAAKTRP